MIERPALHPALRVDLAMSHAFLNLLEEAVDLAIRIGELQDSGLVARRLAPQPAPEQRC